MRCTLRDYRNFLRRRTFQQIVGHLLRFRIFEPLLNETRKKFSRRVPRRNWQVRGERRLCPEEEVREDFGIVVKCSSGWRLGRVSLSRKRRGSGDSPGLQNRRLAPCGVNGAFDSHTLPPISSAPSARLRLAQD